MEYPQNIVDFEKEIRTKDDWQPDEEDAAYRDSLMREFQWAVWQFTNSSAYIAEMSPLEYYEMNLKDSVLVTEPLPDSDDWRNNIRLNDLIDKRDALLSFRESLHLSTEFLVQDALGNPRQPAADMLENLVKYAMEQDEYKEKSKLYNYGLFDFGTQYVRVTWDERQQFKRTERAPFDPMNPDAYQSFLRPGNVLKKIKTEFVQFNRVFLGDYSQWFINDQPYYFIDAVVPYETAYQMFGQWKRWKYVKGYMPENDAWTDLLPDYELDDNSFNRKVRIRIYEKLSTKETAIFCNSVLMTPRGMKLPDGMYSLIGQQAGVLNPRFAVGKSFLANIHNYAMIKDLMANIMVDRSRQDLEPPLKSTFRTLLNRHLFRPANVAQIMGTGELTPLIPETAMRNFAMEVFKMFEGQMDKASVAPIVQGQNTPGVDTKYEVQQQLYNSLRQVELWIQASARMEYQIAGKMADLALVHYPKMSKVGASVDKVKAFVFTSPDGGTSTEIKFAKMPPESDTEGRMKVLGDMAKRERKAKVKGQNLKAYLCDPGEMDGWRWSLRMNVVPNAPESKASVAEDAKKDYLVLLQDAGWDPDFARKLWSKAKGWDYDEAKAKQQQGANPAAPVDPNAPQNPNQPPANPNMPPAPPGGQPLASPAAPAPMAVPQR